MPQTELPTSVVLSSRDLGPGTLSRSENGIKISECRGINLRTNSQIQERSFLIAKDGKSSAVTFNPSQDVDTITLHRQDKPSLYLSRNGVYIEIGREGMMAQYDLNNGKLLLQEVDTNKLPCATLPLEVDDSTLRLVTGVCEQLRILRTPQPEGIAQVAEFLISSIQTSEPVNQGYLFEI